MGSARAPSARCVPSLALGQLAHDGVDPVVDALPLLIEPCRQLDAIGRHRTAGDPPHASPHRCAHRHRTPDAGGVGEPLEPDVPHQGHVGLRRGLQHGQRATGPDGQQMAEPTHPLEAIGISGGQPSECPRQAFRSEQTSLREDECGVAGAHSGGQSPDGVDLAGGVGPVHEVMGEAVGDDVDVGLHYQLAHEDDPRPEGHFELEQGGAEEGVEDAHVAGQHHDRPGLEGVAADDRPFEADQVPHQPRHPRQPPALETPVTVLRSRSVEAPTEAEPAPHRAEDELSGSEHGEVAGQRQEEPDRRPPADSARHHVDECGADQPDGQTDDRHDGHHDDARHDDDPAGDLPPPRGMVAHAPIVTHETLVPA